jgi:hypothetical protein
MKNNIAVTLTLFVSLLCLSASAWMPAPPPGYHPPTLFTVDPTDTNGYSAFVGPSYGMTVQAYSSTPLACAAMTANDVEFTTTNITLAMVDWIDDCPTQQVYYPQEYVFALYPHYVSTNASSWHAFTVNAYSTFTNAGVVFTLTNSLTVSVPAHQVEYTAYFTDANLADTNASDWTNNLCGPTEVIESRFTGTNYTSTNNWYVNPNQFAAPPFIFSEYKDPSFINPLTGKFEPGYIHPTVILMGTPGTKWSPFLTDPTDPANTNPWSWLPVQDSDHGLPVIPITLPSSGRGQFGWGYTSPGRGSLLRAKYTP